LAEEGATLVLSGRSEERGRSIAGELGATFVAGDLVGAGVPERIAGTAIERHGRLDALVNNAAIDHTGDLLDTPLGEVRQVFDVNVFAALRMLQAAARLMAAASGGAIVNVTSPLASIGVPAMGIYGASKGALLALTRAAAVELAPKRIRVNAVAPARGQVDLHDGAFASGSALRAATGRPGRLTGCDPACTSACTGAETARPKTPAAQRIVLHRSLPTGRPARAGAQLAVRPRRVSERGRAGR
jgi:NAD(P)-dependent dehydrogenase (short-subunit alcohol dehydrogenase family)